MITLTAKITLADGTEIDINKRNALSIDESIIDRSNIIMPSWGIISNSGSISFIDYNGKIKEFAQNLKLTSKTIIDIYLHNTNLETPVRVGSFSSNRWNYDNNSNEVRLTIDDGLTKMQDIIISPLNYDLKKDDTYTCTAKDIYDFLQRQTNIYGFDMIATNSSFDIKTLAHLQSINIAHPYIEETNLWRAWNDFAIAYQLHIYKNMKGKIVCIYNGGD